MIVKENDGLRIDSYLANELDLSRSKVQKLIKDGLVLVDGNKVSNSYTVKLNDEIEVNDDLNYDINVEPEDIKLDIVYEDDDLLIINKASGMVVHPAPGHYTGTLVNALIGKYQLSNNELRPGIVHRLDKDTSGLMVVAKTDKVHELLSDLMKTHSVKRTYLALVEGTFNHETGTIDAPIGRDLKYREKMMVTDINSKDAITHFKVLERFSNATLIECNLETGRTHQIRVHMAYIKHPVVNDPIYGKKIDDNDFGQLLHSRKIEFIHPITKENIVFEKDAPSEFYEILKKYVK